MSGMSCRVHGTRLEQDQLRALRRVPGLASGLIESCQARYGLTELLPATCGIGYRSAPVQSKIVLSFPARENGQARSLISWLALIHLQ